MRIAHAVRRPDEQWVVTEGINGGGKRVGSAGDLGRLCGFLADQGFTFLVIDLHPIASAEVRA